MRMMKKLIYISILASTLCLASCQEDEAYTPPVNSSTEVITFSTPYYARSAQMRKGQFKQGDQVGVLGYCISEWNNEDYSNQPWNSKKEFCTPDVFYNQPLAYSDNGMWNYTWSGRWENLGPVGNLHPWHTNEDYTYSFFAYYPYASVSGYGNTQSGTIYATDGRTEMGTITLTGDDVAGDPTITYTMPHDGVNLGSNNEWWVTPDFMLAYVTDHRKADGSVRMNFRHLFCAFEFEINNYNTFPVTVSDLYVMGGTEDLQGNPETGFYRSVTVTGQESGYTVGNDIYIGEYNLVEGASSDGIICPGATVDPTTGELTPYTMPITVDRTTDGDPIALLFIPDADGKITSDGNENISLSLKVTTDEKGVDFEKESSMNLKGSTFQPGVRSIFSINIVGNDFYLQMRSDGQWEDDGDSDIVFE